MGGKGSGRRPNPKPIEELGVNARRNMALLEIRELNKNKKVNTDDAKAIHNRFNEFAEVCIKYDLKPTMEDFCLALGINRSTMTRWKNGVIKKPQEVIQEIEECVAFLNAAASHYLVDGGTPPVSAIFNMANNFDDYHDAREIKVAAAERLDETSTKQLEEKYNKIIEAIDTDYTEVTDD